MRGLVFRLKSWWTQLMGGIGTALLVVLLGTTVVLAAAPKMTQLTFEKDYQVDLTMSPDQKMVAYRKAGTVWTKLLAADAAETRIYEASKDVFLWSLKWSPGGKWLSFVEYSNTDFDDGTLVVLRTDGSEVRRLTDHVRRQYAWNPDETEIAYELSYKYPNRPSLSVVNVNSGKEIFTIGERDDEYWYWDSLGWTNWGITVVKERLLGSGFRELWSPDDKRFWFFRILPNRSFVRDHIWSPDGKTMAFIDMEKGRNDRLWLISRNDNGPQYKVYELYKSDDVDLIYWVSDSTLLLRRNDGWSMPQIWSMIVPFSEFSSDMALVLQPEALIPSPYQSSPLAITDSSWYREDDYVYIVGEVKNNSSQTVQSVKILATFYNSQGKIVDSFETYASKSILSPGQSSPFKFMERYRAGMDTLKVEVGDYDVE